MIKQFLLMCLAIAIAIAAGAAFIDVNPWIAFVVCFIAEFAALVVVFICGIASGHPTSFALKRENAMLRESVSASARGDMEFSSSLVAYAATTTADTMVNLAVERMRIETIKNPSTLITYEYFEKMLREEAGKAIDHVYCSIIPEEGDTNGK